MALLNVNPTHMELTKLKQKLISLKKSHRVMKDKQDELIKHFLVLAKENKDLRVKVENAIKEANYHMSLANGVMSREEIDIALMMPVQKIKLDVKKKSIVSVDVPSYEFKMKSADKADIYSYGFAFTTGELDASVKALSDLLPDMIRLAEVEKSCQLLSEEIEITRRRVNALQFVLIPDYEETIKHITMKLEENERSNAIRLIKVKEVLLQKSYGCV